MDGVPLADPDIDGVPLEKDNIDGEPRECVRTCMYMYTHYLSRCTFQMIVSVPIQP